MSPMKTEAEAIERLRIAREKLGMSQRKLAKEVGCSETSWVNYETGKSLPGFKILQGLSALGIDMDWLFTGEGTPKRTGKQLDQELLETIISLLEQRLDQVNKRLPPDVKATVIKEIYILMSDDEESGAPLDKPLSSLISGMVKVAS